MTVPRFGLASPPDAPDPVTPSVPAPHGPDLPRVLHVLAPGPFGGLESVVAMLAEEWVARGGEVGLALVIDPGHPLADRWTALATAGVEVIPLPVPHRGYRREWHLYRETFRRWQPEIIHCHGYRPDILAGWAARTLRLPRVSTVHGFTGGDWKNRLYERLQIRALAGFDGVIAVSRPIHDRLSRAGVPGQRLAVIPNALKGLTPLSRADARSELGIAEGVPLLGWVGRISAEKGLDVLLAALPHLGDLPVAVSVVGDGPLRDSLQREAVRTGVAGRLHWHGIVDGARRLLPAFDCFVLSSRTEGTPIALLEAMAAGVPVVATTVGGVPDVVRPEEGWLVPSENPAALAAAIREALTDGRGASQRADRARARLSRDFAVGPWLERHAAFYRTIVARKLRDSE
jgi:glycosyltransferase involved in cell wall biosynthesis